MAELVVAVWLLFNVGVVAWLMRRGKGRMETNKCGRIHLGPVKPWREGQLVCQHCNVVLEPDQVATYIRINRVVLDVMADALKAASKTR